MRCVLAVAVALLVALPAPAAAYNAPGPRWPGGTIRYHDSLPPSWDWSIRKAARTWNNSGAKIRFRRVPANRAQLTIGYGRLGSAAGLATIGHNPGAFVRVNSLLYRPLRERDRVFAAQMLAHEFGHVLGLGHVRSEACRLMSTPPLTYCPKPPQPWLYDCHWLARDDARGAVHLYGGKRRKPEREYCPREPAPPQPRDAVVRSGARVRVTWTPVPVQPGTRVVIEVYEAHRCDGDLAAAQLRSARVRMGRARWTDPGGPGTYCYSIGAQNKYGMPAEQVWARGVVTPAWMP